ncbi:MAG: alpha/beta fold hydrolase, partial [Chitinophagales bacterium]|nr:alpha/beta fold hydrolase [Chitinophagales bacterium]
MILNYKKLGESGPTIIILHGLLGSLDNWQTIAKQLSSSHQVYIIDQRNHGRSPHT